MNAIGSAIKLKVSAPAKAASARSMTGLLLIAGMLYGPAQSLSANGAIPPVSSARVVVEFAQQGVDNPDRDLSGTTTSVAAQMKRLSRFVFEEIQSKLAPGDVFKVRFDEIVLAGSMEPWRSPRVDGVRFMTPAYPPRMTLSFRWTAADGTVIREGQRSLTNLDYQRDPRAALSNDSLRYERALLEEWISRELSSR